MKTNYGTEEYPVYLDGSDPELKESLFPPEPEDKEAWLKRHGLPYFDYTTNEYVFP